MGSLSLVCYVASASRMSQEQIRAATRVTEAAIGITWLAGAILVVMGEWYLSTWWYVKIALVVLISAIHTFLHRRWKRDIASNVQTNNAIAPFILGATFLVVLLAVVKTPV